MQQFGPLHVVADKVLPVLAHLYGVQPERHLRGAPPQHRLPKGWRGAAPGPTFATPAIPLAATPLLAEELQAEQPLVVPLVGVGSGLEMEIVRYSTVVCRGGFMGVCSVVHAGAGGWLAPCEWARASRKKQRPH